MAKGQPRKKAREQGLPTYHGRPCKICGGTERKSRSGECVKYVAHQWARMTPEERLAHYEANREANAKYRRKHKERNAKYQREYRARHREAQREYMKLYMREYRRRQSGCKTEQDN